MPIRLPFRGEGEQSFVRRVLVATDRSETAGLAVAWAAEMAARYEAELVVVRVFVPPMAPDAETERDLVEYAREVADDRGRAVLKIGEDPARAIVEAADEADADVLVVGNVGMSGRKEFLLGNVPNRVSHLTRRTLVIVNTAQRIEQRQKRRFGR
ncbi:MAG TPA: universal stress protein [Gaiellaceae bacterium]|nr:universal stress protein [Gaiellaceae bacterium]